MAQGFAVGHQAHGNMAVMAGRDNFFDRFRHLAELGQQLAALRFKLLRPAEGRRGIRFRMAENKRAITLCRVVGIGYRVQVGIREGLRPSRGIRECACAGYFNPA